MAQKAIAEASEVKPNRILDVATGTADLAIAAAELKPQHIDGIDIADQMLVVGRKKIADANLSSIITLQTADSVALPFTHWQF